MTPEVALGRVLRALREGRGLTQERLALEAGYSRYYLGLLEQGARNASVLTLFRLGRVLGVAPSEILRQTEPLVTELPGRRGEEEPDDPA